jgi:hypothetical protein
MLSGRLVLDAKKIELLDSSVLRKENCVSCAALANFCTRLIRERAWQPNGNAKTATCMFSHCV